MLISSRRLGDRCRRANLRVGLGLDYTGKVGLDSMRLGWQS
jgi:hypothetical protein